MQRWQTRCQLGFGIGKCLALLAGPAAAAVDVLPWGCSCRLPDPGRMGPTSFDPSLG